MKNKYKLELVITAFLVGFGLGAMSLRIAIDKFPPTEEKTVAEIQLEKYKEAVEICGFDNVEEIQNCDKSICVARSGEYVCKSMDRAALSDQERAEFKSETLQTKVEEYCRFADRWGFDSIVDFDRYGN